jgi:cysteine desulfurase
VLQATTPLDPRVLDAMLPYWTDQYGNPHSRTHYFGWESDEAVEVARKQVHFEGRACCWLHLRMCSARLPEWLKRFDPVDALAGYSQPTCLVPTSRFYSCMCSAQVADLIGADPKEIIFTSGATESNNLALKGVANFYKERKNHIITTQTDHKCVLDSARYLQQRGFEVSTPSLPACSGRLRAGLPANCHHVLDSMHGCYATRLQVAVKCHAALQPQGVVKVPDMGAGYVSAGPAGRPR